MSPKKTLALALALLLLPICGLRADPDAFTNGLAKRLAAQGLPSAAPMTGDTEDAALGAFQLVALTGTASKDTVAYKRLPFTRALKLQSRSAPDQTWHHFIQRPIGARFAPGDVGGRLERQRDCLPASGRLLDPRRQ